MFQVARRRGCGPQRPGPLSLRFLFACFACVLPSPQFRPARTGFGMLCFRVPGAVDVSRSAQAPGFPGSVHVLVQTRCIGCIRRTPGLPAAPTYQRPPHAHIIIFFPDANTSQWSIAVLDIGFACVSASVQGTGCGTAEQYRAGPAKHKLRIAIFVLPGEGGGGAREVAVTVTATVTMTVSVPEVHATHLLPSPTPSLMYF